ncbi:2-oxoacid:acceptor oxidoreductase family protein [bacterium]|nr:2-oxoacid:acceptor oxidoreductase family protein [bacterium]
MSRAKHNHRAHNHNKEGFKLEIRLAGSGGQGLITAGMILAKAAVLTGRLNSVQTQSYGPEARGGASRSDVIISSYEEIYYPKARKLDLLLAFNEESYYKYIPLLKEEGVLIVDEDYVPEVREKNAVRFPFIRTAKTEIGTPIAANIIAVGFIGGLIKVVGEKALKEAVASSFNEAFREKNLKALEIGYRVGSKQSDRMRLV